MPSGGSGGRRPGDPPVCHRCLLPMKFIGIEPHPHYVNLRNETYECESCGEKTTITVRIA